MDNPDQRAISARTDRLAALLSNLCLVHCLALPLAAVLLPAGLFAGGSESLHGPEWMHWALLSLAFPVSFLALRHGFQEHRRHYPWMLATLGFLMMAMGALLHGHSVYEPALTVGGGVFIALAHWRNIVARRLVTA